MVGIAEIGIGVALFNGGRQAYRWAKKVFSNKWKRERKSHEKFLRGVKQEVTGYQKYSKCSSCKTLITDVNKLREESWSTLSRGEKKDSVRKRLTSDDFVKKLEKAKKDINHHLGLLRNCCKCQATQHTDKAAKLNVTYIQNTYVQNTYVQNSKNLMDRSAARPSNLTLEGNHAVPQTRTKVKKRNDGKPQKSKEFEKQEKEYKTWLKKNIMKWTDSWTRYSERATNSKLDLAEKERLFRKHVDELREQYLRAYRQLLKEVITPDLAIEYLTSWSDAEPLLLQRRGFGLLSKEEREREWRSHADNILKKRKKEKKGHKTK